MSNETFLGLREATTKTLRMGGTDLLLHPKRLTSFILDVADQSLPEVRLAAHQLDDELVAPLIGAMESKSEASLNTAQARICDILTHGRFVNAQLAHITANELVGGLADFLGIPVSLKEPPPDQPTTSAQSPQQPHDLSSRAQIAGGIPPTGPALPNSTVVTRRPVQQAPRPTPRQAPQPMPQPMQPQTPQQYQTQGSKSTTPIVVSIIAVAAILAVAAIIAVPMLRRQGQNKDTAASNSSSSVAVVVNEDPHPLSGETYPVGNLINGGHMACDSSGTIYYADPVDGTDWDTRSIVCRDNDVTLYSAPSATKNLYHINCVGDKLVFNQVIENNSTVECINADGSGHKTLGSCDDWSLCQVDDGWVYYLKSGTVNRCDVDGKNHETLAKVGGKTLWRVFGSKLYTFSEKDATTIYVSDLDGSNQKVAYETSGGRIIQNAIPIEGDKICVWEAGSYMRVGVVDKSGSMDELYTNGNIQRICPFEDGIIITLYENDTDTHIVVIDYSGNQTSELREFNLLARYTCYLNHYIGYSDVSDDLQCKSYLAPISPEYGNGIHILAD